MDRHEFHHDGLTLSYLDSGGEGHVLIALHAHFMEAATFAPLAAALAPDWRVVALDQLATEIPITRRPTPATTTPRTWKPSLNTSV